MSNYCIADMNGLEFSVTHKQILYVKTLYIDTISHSNLMKRNTVVLFLVVQTSNSFF
jgi:hypothetical protein